MYVEFLYTGTSINSLAALGNVLKKGMTISSFGGSVVNVWMYRVEIGLESILGSFGNDAKYIINIPVPSIDRYG